MKIVFRTLIFLLALPVLLLACQNIDLYEKSVTIPGHSWENSFRPSFSFQIKDTSVPYKLYIVLRHTDKYNYNNLFVNISTQQPGQDSTRSGRYDLTLATNEKGWLGSGMDDIYEHRILLTPAGQEFYFKKTGNYIFTIEQIMRENPLKHVMNVGLRLEKKL